MEETKNDVRLSQDNGQAAATAAVATQKGYAMTPSWYLPRRTFLKSASACIALPLLDCMVPNDPARKAKGKPPVRLGWFYVPCGAVMSNWRPAATGVDVELSPILKPLEPVKNRVVVFSEMAAAHCWGAGGEHESTGGSILTGMKCKHSEEPEVGSPSIDQVAARQVGDETPCDALTLGIDQGQVGGHGYSGTYLSNISWRNKTTPAALETNPKDLFDRLFQGRALRAPTWERKPKPAAKTTPTTKADPDARLGTSILDLARDDARRLLSNLGSNDRSKVEGYLDGIRNIERRLDVAQREDAERGPAEVAKMKKPGADTPPELMIPTRPGIPSVYADHVNLLLDIMVMAFWTDTTRVGSFMFSFEKSGRAYPDQGAPGGHHTYSHHDGKPENLAALTKINTFHVSLFARMLTNMSKIKEGDGTLLDNVSLMYFSGISDGSQHNHEDIPVLLAGGGGGVIQRGAHIVTNKLTPLCNLYLNMLDLGGYSLDKFGDSTGRLKIK